MEMILAVPFCYTKEKHMKFYTTDTEKQAIYYRKEQKVYEYARKFFKEMVPYLNWRPYYINDEILPLYCFDETEEIIRSLTQGKDTYITGGALEMGERQFVIRIGLDTQNDRLSPKLKRTIRHEIIHYVLWLANHKNKDDELDFWCYCYVFDGGAYESLTSEDQNKYEMFIKMYDKHLKELVENQRSYAVDTVIRCLDKKNIEMEEFEKVVKQCAADPYGTYNMTF